MSPCAVPENEPDRNYTSDISTINSSFIGTEHALKKQNGLLKDESCHLPGPLENYLSAEGLRTEKGTLRSLAGQFIGMQDVIALSAGYPPPSLFPFASISLNLHDGTSIQFDQTQVNSAQQYNSNLRGQPSLHQWITRHVESLHRPPSPHDIVITNGNNHALEILTSLFLDRGDPLLMEEFCYPVMPESIATPKGYTPIAVPIDEYGIIPHKLRTVLHNYYNSPSQDEKRRIKLLYTIPTGQNPTGASTTLERKKEIYQICREYDIWILEDDPYYYLQWNDVAAMHASRGISAQQDVLAAVPGLTGLMQPLTHNNTNNNTTTTINNNTPLPPSTHQSTATAAAAVTASYLSIDTDQRVIRLDTFSKFLAPGFRLGWVTARHDVVEKLISAIQTHTVGPSSLGQSVVAATLNAWGDSGLDAHLRRVQCEYAMRCQSLIQSMHKHLGSNSSMNGIVHTKNKNNSDSSNGGVIDSSNSSDDMNVIERTVPDMTNTTTTTTTTTMNTTTTNNNITTSSLAEWTVPHAGMFLWVKLHGITDVHQDIWNDLRHAKIIVCPGKAMHCYGHDPQVKCQYVRISYSSVSHDEMDEGVRRIADVLKRYHHQLNGDDVMM